MPIIPIFIYLLYLFYKNRKIALKILCEKFLHLFLCSFFISSANIINSLFDYCSCKKSDPGVISLDFNVSAICSNTIYYVFLFTIIVPFLFFYVLALPLFTLFYLKKINYKHQEPNKNLNIMTIGLKNHLFYWFLIIIYFKKYILTKFI